MGLEQVAANQDQTRYKDLNEHLGKHLGQNPFDFGLERDRAAMGQLLGDVVSQTYEDVGGMLSSIVLYVDRNDAGTGFYKLAIDMGLLEPSPSEAAKEKFWVGEMNKVHARYRRPGRVRPHT